jgi:hypothetical protein
MRSIAISLAHNARRGVAALCLLPDAPKHVHLIPVRDRDVGVGAWRAAPKRTALCHLASVPGATGKARSGVEAGHQ